VELLEREGRFLFQICGVAQRGPGGPDRGVRQPEDAFGRAGSEGNRCRAKAAIGQELREQPAEGVADDDRRPVESADDLVVVVDDICDAEVSERRGISA